MKKLKDKIYKFVKKYLSLPDIEVLLKKLSILYHQNRRLLSSKYQIHNHKKLKLAEYNKMPL